MMLVMPKFTIEDEDLAARLEAATVQSQTSIEMFAANAVARAVADVEAWAEDEAAYAEYERTGEAIPLTGLGAGVRRTSCRPPRRASRLLSSRARRHGTAPAIAGATRAPAFGTRGRYTVCGCAIARRST